MAQPHRSPAEDRENARAESGLPVPRGWGRRSRHSDAQEAALQRSASGGDEVVVQGYLPTDVAAALRPQRKLLALPGWATGKPASRFLHGIRGDLIALFVAILDVWLVVPEHAETYSIWLSGVACSAMLIRRRFPFIAVLITVPGFLVGWSQLSAMIALGTLARRHLWSWRTLVGAALVFACRYIRWPWSEFTSQNWREHALNVIYAIIVAGMPLAIGLLVAARQELAERISELAASRERENRLHAEAVRSSERAKLAREMHDVVSHQVTLIAMQAGALQVAPDSTESIKIAGTIRTLSTRTLDELRDLVGLLRSGTFDDAAQPGLEELGQLVRGSDVSVQLVVRAQPEDLPSSVSRAAYRTVQEALTNVRKHAGGANATVTVVAYEDRLVVEVANSRPGSLRLELPSGGHGLVGLEERAGLLGGTFDAGPTEEGGFRVQASYPLG